MPKRNNRKKNNRKKKKRKKKNELENKNENENELENELENENTCGICYENVRTKFNMRPCKTNFLYKFLIFSKFNMMSCKQCSFVSCFDCQIKLFVLVPEFNHSKIGWSCPQCRFKWFLCVKKHDFIFRHIMINAASAKDHLIETYPELKEKLKKAKLVGKTGEICRFIDSAIILELNHTMDLGDRYAFLETLH